MELRLWQEYRDVLPMFAYVVETERRFYLCNKVDVSPHDGPGGPVVRGRAERRVGLGHVPARAVREQGQRGHHRRRERRGAAPRRTSGPTTRRRPARRSSSERGSAPLAAAPTAASVSRGILRWMPATPRIAIGARGEDAAADRYSPPAIGCWRATGGAVSVRSTWSLARGSAARRLRGQARRGSGLGGPFEAVTAREAGKLRRLAQAYLLAEPRSLARIGVGDVRFDVASATVAGGGSSSTCTKTRSDATRRWARPLRCGAVYGRVFSVAVLGIRDASCRSRPTSAGGCPRSS